MEINLSFSFFSVFVDADHPTLVPPIVIDDSSWKNAGESFK